MLHMKDMQENCVYGSSSVILMSYSYSFLPTLIILVNSVATAKLPDIIVKSYVILKHDNKVELCLLLKFFNLNELFLFFPSNIN